MSTDDEFVVEDIPLPRDENTPVTSILQREDVDAEREEDVLVPEKAARAHSSATFLRLIVFVTSERRRRRRRRKELIGALLDFRFASKEFPF